MTIQILYPSQLISLTSFLTFLSFLFVFKTSLIVFYALSRSLNDFSLFITKKKETIYNKNSIIGCKNFPHQINYSINGFLQISI